MKKSKLKIDVPIPTTYEESKRLSKIFKTTKTLIATMSTVLLFFFGWLEFKNITLPMFDEKFANAFYKIVLALYFFCWVFGTNTDLSDEEYTLVIAPNKGELTNLAIGMLFAIGVLFGILCWVHTYKAFAIALTVFFGFNIISWRFLLKFLKPTLDVNKKKVAKSIIGKFKIEIIEKYLWGNWQWFRFGIGFLVLIIINILAFTNLSQVIASFLKIPSSQFIFVFSIFIFICVMEIYIWYIRLCRKISLKVLTDIENKL